MSDPSPWAEEPSVWDDEFTETTQENVRRAEDEAAEEERQEYQNRYLWKKYASRLRADGRLTR